MDPALKAASILTLIHEDVHFMPRRALRTHLAGIRDILRQQRASQASISFIPKDPQSCRAMFHIDPITRSFLCCPQCHCLYSYALGDDPEFNLQPAISHCTYQQTVTSPICGTSLWKRRRMTGEKVVSEPVKKYLHQDLKHWVGRLLSRKGIEEHLSGSPYLPQGQQRPDVIDDIWLSDAFVQLKDVSGRPFYPGPSTEGRLVFSLSVDSFDPFGNKTAKQSISSTGIWLVLLNLPWYLRYLPQNIYLAGVIPGPDKPSLDKIKHYLQLVVDELKEFWNPGVFFSRTYKHPLGQLFFAIVIPVVCDMLAARQVIGYASAPTAHYFCTACELDIDDIDILDRGEWPDKELVHIRCFAMLWKNAQSEEDQKVIFEACGWRWSPLFDLPYWNPILHTIVDSMHTLDLNLLNNHCRTLFRIDIAAPGGESSPPADFSNPSRDRARRTQDHKMLDRCLILIEANPKSLLYQLLEFHRQVLYTVCIDYNILGPGKKLVAGTRWILAQNIYTWVCICPSLIHLNFI